MKQKKPLWLERKSFKNKKSTIYFERCFFKSIEQSYSNWNFNVIGEDRRLEVTNYMAKIVIELQHEALKSDFDIMNLLRKCLSRCKKIKITGI